jgi:phage tail sheath gpL-like
MSSNAVSQARISTIVGYDIDAVDFNPNSPNLPQRVVVLAEANEDNQLTLNTEKFEATSAQQVAARCGYGSPMHINARILFPATGDGVGGIPVVFIPQAKASGATAKILSLAATGTATANGTHYVVIAGRDNIDGEFYAVNIETGDTPDDIHAKIADAVNNILGAPVTATDDAYSANFTSKWKGKTADKISVTVDVGDDALGITYAVTSVQSGSGVPSISSALAQIGNEWVTFILNSYGTESAIMTALEIFNGVPRAGLSAPTGRYQGIVWKPLIAITGTTDEDPSAISDARLGQVTIAFAPAPLSAGLPMEAAANVLLNEVVLAQNTPSLDIQDMPYPDMPTPKSIGMMADYDNRDAMVKKGCSTVDLVGGKYVMKDFVTTFHPEGEPNPAYRYVRNVNIHWNMRFRYLIAEKEVVLGHTICEDDDIVTAEKTVKPKQFRQRLGTLADEAAKDALIVKPDFTKASIKVNIGKNNPDRFEVSYSYKISGFGRIVSTTVKVGFNFGILE